MDLTLSTPEELDHIEQAIRDERIRRQNTALIDEKVRAVIEEARANGLQDQRGNGEPWVPPSGAHDSYVAGDEVEHQGKRWTSTVDANAWEPGVAGWREVREDGTFGEYVQPSGAADAYRTGDVITWRGGVYQAVGDHLVWSPDDYPGGWRKIAEDDPAAGEDPTGEDTTDGPAEWVVGISYTTGDRVTYQGTLYEVLQPHTSAAHWPPDQVASLYRAV